MGMNFWKFTHDELATIGFDFDVGEDGIFQAQKDFNLEFVVADDIYYHIFHEMELREQDAWCEENLQGYFKLDKDQSSFQFEEDAMAFKLRWL